MHIGQPNVSAAVAVCELLLIEAHEMENRCVEIVNVHFVFDGVPSEVIGGAVNVAALHATARHAQRIAVRVMLATVFALTRRGAAEFAAPNDERVFEQAALFQIFDQAGYRLVGGGGCFCG